MRVWLINSSEAAPVDGKTARLRRMGILADLLADRGHLVLWWNSTFHHVLKTQRFCEDTKVTARDNYHLWFLRAPAYRRNVSLKRLWNHHVLGRKFRLLAGTEPVPDVILCSFPTLELSFEAVRYGTERGIPVVLDIRDMWPDIFMDLVPRWTRPLARLALRRMFKTAREACAGAFAICGHAPAFVDWGLEVGKRRRSGFDRDFPFAYAVRAPHAEETQRATEFWSKYGLEERSGVPVACFFGAINRQFDLGTVMRAARSMQSKKDVRFVLCGGGVRLAEYREMAEDCGNIIFPGWVDAPEIRALMRMSRFALAPYVSRPDYELSMPNKAIEYLSGGLPILTSLSRGYLVDMLTQHDCGMSYGGRAERLVEVICSLCDAPARRDTMAENAQQLFRGRFTAEKVYGEMAGYLEEIAAARPTPARSGAPSAAETHLDEHPSLSATDD